MLCALCAPPLISPWVIRAKSLWDFLRVRICSPLYIPFGLHLDSVRLTGGDVHLFARLDCFFPVQILCLLGHEEAASAKHSNSETASPESQSGNQINENLTSSVARLERVTRLGPAVSCPSSCLRFMLSYLFGCFSRLEFNLANTVSEMHASAVVPQACSYRKLPLGHFPSRKRENNFEERKKRRDADWSSAAEA